MPKNSQTVRRFLGGKFIHLQIMPKNSKIFFFYPKPKHFLVLGSLGFTCVNIRLPVSDLGFGLWVYTQNPCLKSKPILFFGCKCLILNHLTLFIKIKTIKSSKNNKSVIFHSSCKVKNECNFKIRASNDEEGNFIETKCCEKDYCNRFNATTRLLPILNFILFNFAILYNFK